MDAMQQELRATYPVLRIQFLGVNEKGQEPGNPSITAGRTLPWLQDVDADGNAKSDVWYDRWNVTYRDVVILDGSNAKVGVYNVTVHDLAAAGNYAALKEMLVDAAMTSQKPWRNADNPLDVDHSQSVVALDALVIINRLNSTGAQDLPPPTTSQLTPPFYDCNGDNQVTALDALQVINFLNGVASAGAGEGEGDAAAMDGPAVESDAIATDAPGPVSGSPQPDLQNAHFEPAASQDDEGKPTGEAAWPSRVDLAFAAAAVVGRESTTSLPMRRASPPSWNANDSFDLPAELESLPDGI